MRIAIISDTHLPRGAKRLPDRCVQQLRGAEIIVHAGDFNSLAVLEELRTFGPDVVAVHGNVDSPGLRAELPERAEFEAHGTRIGLIHDAGPGHRRLERMQRRFPDTDAVIFGHSHIPLHERGEDGFQIFNPGSPTEKRRAPGHTMGIARVQRGRISFELIGLD